MGHKVGLLDVDITAPKLSRGLGLSETPEWVKDSQAEVVLPTEVDGLYILTMASHLGDKPAVLWDEPTLIDAIRQMITGVVRWPNDLDYLLIDSPPSSSGLMQALYSYLSGVCGVVLVFQPTDMAAADLLRTLDFIKFKKVPIIGLISNMAYCVSPSGEEFWPFLSPKIELAETCNEFGIPILGTIPLTSDGNVVSRAFDQVAAKLNMAKPIVLTDSIIARLHKAITIKVLKAVVRRL